MKADRRRRRRRLYSLSRISITNSRKDNALVIGNATYKSVAALKTPIADASKVAQTLLAAGYEVTEQHDASKADIGPKVRDFVDKVSARGPQAVAIFYYTGYAAQSHGESFLIPVDATINDDSDVGREPFRLKPFIRELAKTSLAAHIIILDASRDDYHFGLTSSGPATKGLAAEDMTPGTG